MGSGASGDIGFVSLAMPPATGLTENESESLEKIDAILSAITDGDGSVTPYTIIDGFHSDDRDAANTLQMDVIESNVSSIQSNGPRTLTLTYVDSSGDAVRNVIAEITNRDRQVSDSQGVVRFGLSPGPVEVKSFPPYGYIIPAPSTIDVTLIRTITTPTSKQAEAGNYRMAHVRVQGLDITIETPRGRSRKPGHWPRMAAHYGYIKRTLGNDGDHVDVFVGPHPDSQLVTIIDQVGKVGKFDEHKCLVGFITQQAAVATYKKCFTPGWNVGPVTTMTMGQFKAWLKEGTQKHPVEDQVSRYAAEFDENKHPRDERGQFVKGEKHTVNYTNKKGEVKTREAWKMPGGVDLPAHLDGHSIPPGWNDVKISLDEHAKVVASGVDTKGRRQSIYSKSHSIASSKEKFTRIQKGIIAFKDIQKKVELDVASEDASLADSASVFRLIQHSGIRPGSEVKNGSEKQAYGATTLLGRHVIQTKDGVELQFVGKKGVDLTIPIKDDEIAKDLLSRKLKGDEEKLFSTNSVTLRKYTKTLGEFKTKDFRTIKGTMLAQEIVANHPVPASEKEYKSATMEVAKHVSIALGNTPKIALQSYIDPLTFTQWSKSSGTPIEYYQAISDDMGSSRSDGGSRRRLGRSGRRTSRRNRPLRGGNTGFRPVGYAGRIGFVQSFVERYAASQHSADASHRWITTENGSHVLIDNKGVVTSGMGGKFNGKPLGDHGAKSRAAPVKKEKQTSAMPPASPVAQAIRGWEADVAKMKADQAAKPDPKAHPLHHSKLTDHIQQALLMWNGDTHEVLKGVGQRAHGAEVAERSRIRDLDHAASKKGISRDTSNDKPMGDVIKEAKADEFNSRGIGATASASSQVPDLMNRLKSIMDDAMNEGVDIKPHIKHNNLIPRDLAARLPGDDSLFHPLEDHEKFAAMVAEVISDHYVASSFC